MGRPRKNPVEVPGAEKSSVTSPGADDATINTEPLAESSEFDVASASDAELLNYLLSYQFSDGTETIWGNVSHFCNSL